MSAVLLNSDERAVVIFKLWPSLPYGSRMALSLSLVFGGILLQCLGLPVVAGFILILAGNALLLVQGYDNRVKFDAYSPDSEWETVPAEKLTEFKSFQKRVVAWDRSLLDVSNPLGAVTLLGAVLVPMVFLRVVAPGRFFAVFFADAVLLLAPHWLSGMRRVSVLVKPALSVRIDALLTLLRRVRGSVEDAGGNIDTYVQLASGKTRVPQDVKLKISFPGQSPDFLGFYVQVVTNNVQGRDYPYVYTVTVAKHGYGLKQVADSITTPRGQTKEFESKTDVEFIVLRQTTTKRSGYHTKPGVAASVFRTGFDIAQRAVALKQQV